MPAIRRHIHIATSPRAVWRAISTSAGLQSWLAGAVRLEERVGGRVVLTFDPGGEPREERGMVHRWRPISHLEIAFDNIGEFDSKGTHVAFQITRDGDETRLSVIQSGGERLEDEEVRSRLDERWRLALATLQEQLDRP